MKELKRCVICDEPVPEFEKWEGAEAEMWEGTGYCCGHCCKKGNNCSKEKRCVTCPWLHKKCIPANETKKDLTNITKKEQRCKKIGNV